MFKVNNKTPERSMQKCDFNKVATHTFEKCYFFGKCDVRTPSRHLHVQS